MEKYIFDKKNGLWYELQRDYYQPCLTLSEEEQPIGIWGQRHRRYLKSQHKTIYAELLISGRLNGYLADIDRQAEELFLRLVNQMADAECITEKLKACDQMKWVGQMNSIQSRATEIRGRYLRKGISPL